MLSFPSLTDRSTPFSLFVLFRFYKPEPKKKRISCRSSQKDDPNLQHEHGQGIVGVVLVDPSLEAAASSVPLESAISLTHLPSGIEGDDNGEGAC